MNKRILIYIVAILTILFGGTVYGIVVDQNQGDMLNLSTIAGRKTIRFEYNNELANINKKIQFITDRTGLSAEVAEFLLEVCKEKELNLFIVLGLMKVESNFNPKLVGSKGERGLGQLMENTAKPLAENLGLIYEPQLLFKPEYNIQLFTTQLKYLHSVYKNDIHKVLTAYNRGQYGLKKYIASRSGERNPAKSIYSSRVLQYATAFQNDFNKEYNQNK